jgi:hypothetical protein
VFVRPCCEESLSQLPLGRKQALAARRNVMVQEKEKRYKK